MRMVPNKYHLDYPFRGAEFDGRHSIRDIGIFLAEEEKVGMPSKVKLARRATLSNRTHDFSAMYGHQVFTDRPIELAFHLFDADGRNAVNIEYQKIRVMNWLMAETGRRPLKLDKIPDFYFMAEVVDEPDFETAEDTGILTVPFIADPFMIDEQWEGGQLWKDFRFELDVLQERFYEIIGEREFTLINSGVGHTRPTINASKDCIVILNGDTPRPITIKAGSDIYQAFVLKPGVNDIKVIGSTELEFWFHKEVI